MLATQLINRPGVEVNYEDALVISVFCSWCARVKDYDFSTSMTFTKVGSRIMDPENWFRQTMSTKAV